MAGERTIGIRFTGAADDLSKASKEADESVSRVAGAAENLDDKGSKATDSLGALSSGFELVGLDQYAAGLQSVALATDFMSGVGTGLNLIMELQSVQWVKNKVAAIAYAVQQKIVAAASKTWAAAQWLLNAAMTANPIGLVVLAIVGLIAIIVLAWKKSETFRNIVTGALNAVLSVASAVGKWFTGTFWPWIKGVWDKVAAGAVAAKDGVARAINGLVDWAKNVPGRIGRALGGLWNGISSGIGAAVDWVAKKANGLVTWVGGLPKRIGKAVGGMWDGIKNAFKSAINWIIGRWNNLQFTIPSIDTHIPGVGKVGGFTLGTPDIPYLAAGGTAIKSGAAVVGEKGPEILELTRGASVVPLDRYDGGDVAVYITIDGQQLQGRIDKTVRANNRELKRTVKAA